MVPLMSKSGVRYTVLMNATARRDAHGNIVGAIGVGQDITQLNQVSRATGRGSQKDRDLCFATRNENRLGVVWHTCVS